VIINLLQEWHLAYVFLCDKRNKCGIEQSCYSMCKSYILSFWIWIGCGHNFMHSQSLVLTVWDCDRKQSKSILPLSFLINGKDDYKVANLVHLDTNLFEKSGTKCSSNLERSLNTIINHGTRIIWVLFYYSDYFLKL
jgi:hypothetical protein